MEVKTEDRPKGSCSWVREEETAGWIQTETDIPGGTPEK